MEPLDLSPVGAELLDDPAADPAARRRVAPQHRPRRTDGSAARRRCGSGSPAPSAASRPARTLTLARPRHRARRPAARRACAGRARRGIRLVPVGLERSRVAARLAHGRGVPCAVGCAGAPPFRDKSVDVVLVSQVAHHLARRLGGPPASGPATGSRAAPSSSRTSAAEPLGPARLLGAARGRSGSIGVTVADGMTSIRRGYTAARAPRPARRGRRRAHGRAAPGLPAGGHLAPGGGLMRTVDRTRMRAPVERVLRGRGGRRALARAAAALPLGAHAGAPGDGGLVEMAAWRPFGPLKYPDLVGVGDVGGPGGAGGALPPRARHHDRHGRGVADRAGRRTGPK